jgi:hypothetical protein
VQEAQAARLLDMKQRGEVSDTGKGYVANACNGGYAGDGGDDRHGSSASSCAPAADRDLTQWQVRRAQEQSRAVTGQDEYRVSSRAKRGNRRKALGGGTDREGYWTSSYAVMCFVVMPGCFV